MKMTTTKETAKIQYYTTVREIVRIHNYPECILVEVDGADDMMDPICWEDVADADATDWDYTNDMLTIWIED